MLDGRLSDWGIYYCGIYNYAVFAISGRLFILSLFYLIRIDHINKRVIVAVIINIVAINVSYILYLSVSVDIVKKKFGDCSSILVFFLKRINFILKIANKKITLF